MKAPRRAEERHYFAAHADPDTERARLLLLEQVHDPATIRHLLRLGVGEGWCCLEVGAGAGSIARWLGDRVGPTGRVVAADIDVRFLDHLDSVDLPNTEVRSVDIVSDDLEEDSYDLIHCRGVLFHLNCPDAIVSKLVRGLRPGGLVLLEEADLTCFGPIDETHPLTTGAVLRRMIDFARAAGIWNPFIGRDLPAMLAQRDLRDEGNEAVIQIVRGGHPMAAFVERSYQYLDPAFITNGVVTEAEIRERGEAMADPGFWFLSHMMVSAWGRRRS